MHRRADVDMHRVLETAGDAAVVLRELALGPVERDYRGQVVAHLNAPGSGAATARPTQARAPRRRRRPDVRTFSHRPPITDHSPLPRQRLREQVVRVDADLLMVCYNALKWMETA